MVGSFFITGWLMDYSDDIDGKLKGLIRKGQRASFCNENKWDDSPFVQTNHKPDLPGLRNQ